MTDMMCNSNENSSERKTVGLSQEHSETHFEDSVPDRGWGWLIVISIATFKLATFGVLPLLAIIFKTAITSDPRYEGSGVTLLVGVFFLAEELTGVFFPTLNRKFSLRATSVGGGIILVVGGIASIFAVTIPQLVVSYGVLQGAGYALMITSTFTAFNQHFRRLRTTAMATSQFALSMLSVGLPHAVQAAIDAGGEKAGRSVVAALCIVAAAAQFLVRGVPRPINAATNAQQPLQESEETNNDAENVSRRHEYNMESTFKKKLRRRAQAVWNHFGFSHPSLRTAAVWGPAMGVALVHVGDSNFFALLPLHFIKVGLDKEEVTRAIVTANIGDAVGRLALIVLGIWLGEKNRYIFAVSSFGTAICVLGISWLVSWQAILSFSALLGMFRGTMYVTMMLVFAESVEPSLFPSMFALFLFCIFVSSLTTVPLIGLVRDATSSYPASFCFVAALCAFYPVTWTAHALWLRCTRTAPAVPSSGLQEQRTFINRREAEDSV